jgi:hypothetical protein
MASIARTDEPRWLERLTSSFNSRATSVLTVLACGAIAGALEYMTHIAVAHMGPPLAFHASVDAGVIALLTMTIVSAGIVAARARRRRMIQELKTVAELNHHVRNALQVIRDSHLLPEEQQTQAVIESVDRIDKTLRRLFPATSTPMAGPKAEMLRDLVARKGER